MTTHHADPTIDAVEDEQLARLPVVTIGGPTQTGSRRRALLRELWSDKSAMIGVLVLVMIVLVALFAPLLAPHDPSEQNLLDRLVPPAWYDGGSWTHVLGTDSLGRDVLSRMIYGTRVTLQIGVLVVLIAGTFGTTMGVLAGYRGGRVEMVIMRTVDIQFAFPGLLLAITIIAVAGASMRSLIVVLSMGAWMVFARVARASTLAVKEAAFVEAAETVGCRPVRVVTRYILPNIVSPLLTLAIIEFATVVLAEASLSFLGLGIQPPAISLGLDVATGRSLIFSAWWLVTFPGLVVAVIVLSSNLVAGWLRVVADPQERDKRFAKSNGAGS